MQQLHEEMTAMLAWPEARLRSPEPAVSAWSPMQHLHHLSSINESILKGLLATCEGREEAPLGGRPTLAGVLVLTLGRIPRGRVTAPERFRPAPDVSHASVGEVVAAARGFLDALEPYLPTLARFDGRRPHPALGRLNTRQWLRFARIHTAHHLAIVRELDAHRTREPSTPQPAA